jgi:hypothetical protein
MMAKLCDSSDCSFAETEYVGGQSPAEPDMRAVRGADATAAATFLAANPEDKEATNSVEEIAAGQPYQAELQRKQSLRSIQYYYRGKPVTQGPLARAQAVSARH